MFLDAPMEVLSLWIEDYAEFWERAWSPFLPFFWWM